MYCVVTEFMAETLGMYRSVRLCYRREILKIHPICKKERESTGRCRSTLALFIQGIVTKNV